MYVQVSYYCQGCMESKLFRFGNKGLPAESLRFQIETKGFVCPSCGFKIQNIQPENYTLTED